MGIQILEEAPIFDEIIEIELEDKSGNKKKIRGKLTDAWFPWMNNIKDIFDVYFTSIGFLPPMMTKEERDAIDSPPDGLTVWITTSAGIGVRELHTYRGDPVNAWYKYDMTAAP